MQEVNVSYYEIDGKDYLIAKKLDYEGSTYVLLVNEKDYNDSLVQKEENDNLLPVENVELLYKVLCLMKDNK
ncbi:MAG: hypothetical protein IKX00_01750 [Bacilli bacterium]|nr:hypothetical protein [Bacilli bacterium]